MCRPPDLHHGRSFQRRLWHPEPADHGQIRHAYGRSSLPSAAAQVLVAQLGESLAERELRRRNVLSGTEDAMQDQTTPSLHARGTTPDDGDGDDEHLLARKRTKIQCLITACVGTGIQQGLLQMYGLFGCSRGLSNSAPRRLTTPGWRLNPHHGPVLGAPGVR